MKLWKWQSGRQQDCEYHKFPLWYFRIWKLGFDAYILKYEPDSFLPWHTDKVENGKHWRMNINITGAASFIIIKNDTPFFYLQRKIIIFRPDVFSHSLKVGNKKCIKLSIGLVKFK